LRCRHCQLKPTDGFECLKHISLVCLPSGLFHGKRVIEVGGGQSCLAGLTVGACAADVLLTDGNQESAQNLAAIVSLNPALRLSSQLYRFLSAEQHEPNNYKDTRP
jgi:hypothetical protein